MGHDLTLTASRDITVNKTGLQTKQTYDIFIMNMELDRCNDIINSEDPYTAYCNHLIECDSKDYWAPEPIYIWDIEPITPEIEVRQLKSILDEPQPEDVVGYKRECDRLIEDLQMYIEEAIRDGYDLIWYID